MASATATDVALHPPTTANVNLPRVQIVYCTQCKWLLRAAYFAQELLSTFETTIGEVALTPATGGIFRVHLEYHPKVKKSDDEVTKDAQGTMYDNVEVQSVLIWDRKAEGGFPETKVLKQKIRDHLDPNRDLGHSDKHGKKGKPTEASTESTDATAVASTENPVKRNPDGSICEDCK